MDLSSIADDIAAARSKELEMQARDAQVRQLLAERNSMEAYMYEVKSAAGMKHGNLIDSAVLNKKME